jgi:hypothetical protein
MQSPAVNKADSSTNIPYGQKRSPVNGVVIYVVIKSVM